MLQLVLDAHTGAIQRLACSDAGRERISLSSAGLAPGQVRVLVLN